MTGIAPGIAGGIAPGIAGGIAPGIAGGIAAACVVPGNADNGALFPNSELVDGVDPNAGISAGFIAGCVIGLSIRGCVVGLSATGCSSVTSSSRPSLSSRLLFIGSLLPVSVSVDCSSFFTSSGLVSLEGLFLI